MNRPNENLVQSARGALDKAMSADERVMVLGEDVAGGGPFAPPPPPPPPDQGARGHTRRGTSP